MQVRLFHAHPEAVHAVQRHVNQQSQSREAQERHETENAIKRNGFEGMQGMKGNAAAIGVKYRCGKKMVEIDQVRTAHDQPCPPPTGFEGQASNDSGNQEV